MYKIILAFVLVTISTSIYSQTIKYAPLWFGPNANPVPEFTDATIPEFTTGTITADYYYAKNDHTENLYIKFEVPFISKRLSLKVWSTLLEHYQTSKEIQELRGAKYASGSELGDIYVQTRFSILSEQNNRPAVILNSTLKTASAKTVTTRRYFDTPGYYFDLEIAKSFYLKSPFIDEIRLVGDIGFLCWETSGSLQNDAPMYGAKIITGTAKWKWENSISGYYGWIHTNKFHNPDGDYGDTPLVYTSKFLIKKKNIDLFAQYQYGIKDFPYNQFRIGITFPLKKLTPRYKLEK